MRLFLYDGHSVLTSRGCCNQAVGGDTPGRTALTSVNTWALMVATCSLVGDVSLDIDFTLLCFKENDEPDSVVSKYDREYCMQLVIRCGYRYWSTTWVILLYHEWLCQRWFCERFVVFYLETGKSYQILWYTTFINKPIRGSEIDVRTKTPARRL